MKSCLRLYKPFPWPPAGEEFILDEEQAGHVRVLRLQSGDFVEFFDGEKASASAVITGAGGRKTTARIIEIRETDDKPPFDITIIQGLPKSDKMDYIIQKCTELGVTTLLPVETRRSAARLNPENAESKTARWRKIAIEAARQCGRVHVPLIMTSASFESACRSADADMKLLFDCGAGMLLADFLDKRRAMGADAKSAAVAVGPEGGFSPEEVVMAADCGFSIVSLGGRILRTETAAGAVASVLNFLFGDFGRKVNER